MTCEWIFIFSAIASSMILLFKRVGPNPLRILCAQSHLQAGKEEDKASEKIALCLVFSGKFRNSHKRSLQMRSRAERRKGAQTSTKERKDANKKHTKERKRV